jgi:tetratricopeptide (TPR) repeat protein
MVFPRGLSTPYGNTPNGQPLGKFYLAMALLAAITAGAIFWRKKRPYLLAGWLWYLGMLVPVIGIIQISTAAAHADRYTYLPGIGVLIAVTWAAADWSTGWKFQRPASGILMAALIGILAVCGRNQTAHWKDSESLWKRALTCTSNNFVAFNNMGTLLVKQGNLPDAITDFKTSLEIEPDNTDAINNLGNAYAVQGATEAAIAQYQRALAIRPDYNSARYNLGNVLLRHGRLDEAIVQFRRAVDLAPDDADDQIALGNALVLKGDPDGATACLEKIAGTGSNSVSNWCALGDGFLHEEQMEAAILCYRQALKINPRLADTFANLATAYLRRGQTREAMDSWQQAIAIAPAHLQALNNLGLAMAITPDLSLRNGAKAVALATQASQLSGGANPLILHTLAAAYAADGSFKLAADTARRALELAQGQTNSALAATLQKEITLFQSNTALWSVPR